MKTVLLACNAGMSTSLLVQKMQKEAEAQGLDVQIKANPLNKALEMIDQADCLLLGPPVCLCQEGGRRGRWRQARRRHRNGRLRPHERQEDSRRRHEAHGRVGLAPHTVPQNGITSHEQARQRAEGDGMATEEENLEATQEAAFQIIATVGSAKSQYIEAIQKAKEGDIAGAKALIESGDKDFGEGHTAHLSLLQQSAIDNSSVTFSLILVHAEDQLMQAESFRIIARDFIDVYERIGAKG